MSVEKIIKTVIADKLVERLLHCNDNTHTHAHTHLKITIIYIYNE